MKKAFVRVVVFVLISIAALAACQEITMPKTLDTPEKWFGSLGFFPTIAPYIIGGLILIAVIRWLGGGKKTQQ